MDANVITELISQVGFPIVVSGALFWQIVKQNASHEEESKGFIQAINNNTTALTRLLDRLDSKVDKEDE